MENKASPVSRKRDTAGRFAGPRANVEQVPRLPTFPARWVLEDPRRRPYLVFWTSNDGENRWGLKMAPTDERNLWPEPWGTPANRLTSRGPFPPAVVGAKAKDAVENALHKEVCAGTLTLKEAQTIISTDWYKYYRDRVLK